MSTSTFTCLLVHKCTGVELGNWQHVWLSDKSHFLLQQHDGRHVYRRSNEGFANNCVDIFGGGSAMMWKAISYTGRSELVFIQDNLTAVHDRDEIICHHMVHILDWQRLLFSQDNTIHTHSFYAKKMLHSDCCCWWSNKVLMSASLCNTIWWRLHCHQSIARTLAHLTWVSDGWQCVVLHFWWWWWHWSKIRWC